MLSGDPGTPARLQPRQLRRAFLLDIGLSIAGKLSGRQCNSLALTPLAATSPDALPVGENPSACAAFVGAAQHGRENILETLARA